MPGSIRVLNDVVGAIGAKEKQVGRSISREVSSDHPAAVCTKLGAPLELQHDWRLPPLGPTDVRVRIAAAGINYADLLQACA